MLANFPRIKLIMCTYAYKLSHAQGGVWPWHDVWDASMCQCVCVPPMCVVGSSVECFTLALSEFYMSA